VGEREREGGRERERVCVCVLGTMSTCVISNALARLSAQRLGRAKALREVRRQKEEAREGACRE